ncbi:MAG: hypothetical protein WC725_04835 [Patescibacteria group bacterium]|jgi:hypothetical protein
MGILKHIKRNNLDRELFLNNRESTKDMWLEGIFTKINRREITKQKARNSLAGKFCDCGQKLLKRYGKNMYIKDVGNGCGHIIYVCDFCRDKMIAQGYGPSWL